jgi:hypothetical protein
MENYKRPAGIPVFFQALSSFGILCPIDLDEVVK